MAAPSSSFRLLLLFLMIILSHSSISNYRFNPVVRHRFRHLGRRYLPPPNDVDDPILRNRTLDYAKSRIRDIERMLDDHVEAGIEVERHRAGKEFPDSEEYQDCLVDQHIRKDGSLSTQVSCTDMHTGEFCSYTYGSPKNISGRRDPWLRLLKVDDPILRDRVLEYGKATIRDIGRTLLAGEANAEVRSSPFTCEKEIPDSGEYHGCIIDHQYKRQDCDWYIEVSCTESHTGNFYSYTYRPPPPPPPAEFSWLEEVVNNNWTQKTS